MIYEQQKQRSLTLRLKTGLLILALNGLFLPSAQSQKNKEAHTYRYALLYQEHPLNLHNGKWLIRSRPLPQPQQDDYDQRIEIVDAKLGEVLSSWLSRRRITEAYWSKDYKYIVINDKIGQGGDSLYIFQYRGPGNLQRLRKPNDDLTIRYFRKYKKITRLLSATLFCERLIGSRLTAVLYCRGLTKAEGGEMVSYEEKVTLDLKKRTPRWLFNE